MSSERVARPFWACHPPKAQSGRIPEGGPRPAIATPGLFGCGPSPALWGLVELMRIPRKWWVRFGLGALAVVVVAGIAAVWVVPAVIVGQIRKQYGGHASIDGWWLGIGSAGVSGLALHEGADADSPAWARLGKISTDLSLGKVLTGRFAVDRVEVTDPTITIRVARDGQALTKIPLAKRDPTAPAAKLPEVVATGARLVFEQEGREPMVVENMTGRLEPEADGSATLSARADDPDWGRPTASGTIGKEFSTLAVHVKADRLEADPTKARRIPFVPEVTWEHVEPTGPVGMDLTIAGGGAGQPLEVRTLVRFEGTDLKLPTLGLDSAGTVGTMTVDGGVVLIEDAQGEALGGQVSGSGTLDFAREPSRIDFDLRLASVNVADAPEAWQLGEVGLTGTMAGQVHLVVDLGDSGVDLSGTTGQATVTDGTLGGIPVKSLKLNMTAEGEELQYESTSASGTDAAPAEPSTPATAGPTGSTSGHPSGTATATWAALLIAFQTPTAVSPPGGTGSAYGLEPERNTGGASPTSKLVRASAARGSQQDAKGAAATPRQDPLPAPTAAAGGQQTPSDAPSAGQEKPKRGGFILPKSISTEVEFEDVDLTQVLSKADALGIHLPFVAAGKLSLKAQATIPLGSLKDVKSYAFHGEATLTSAHVAGVDLGRLTARLDLEDGVLELSKFHGQFVELPAGGLTNKPPETDPIPEEGPLPPGGFRGHLRAELSPMGPLVAKFEGRDVPLGEVLAPILPKPTPISGLIGFDADVKGDLAHAADPMSWTASAKLASREVQYRGATLNSASVMAALEGGTLTIKDLEATLEGSPLAGSGTLALAEPYNFDVQVHSDGWDLVKLLALVPTAPSPPPVSGTLSGRAEATGTLSPLKVSTTGEGVLGRFEVGEVAVGDVPVTWQTDPEAIVIDITDAHPFGGTVSVNATIPAGGGPIQGALTASGIDAEAIAAALPGKPLELTGTADARGTFTIRPGTSVATTAFDSDIRLESPGLTVQGIPATAVQGKATADAGVIHYDLYAESLGGKLKFQGDLPLVPVEPAPATDSADAEPPAPPDRPATPPNATSSGGPARFQAIGFALRPELWRALGGSEALAKIQGLGAMDVEVWPNEPAGLKARGVAEFRDLRYGDDYPLGEIRGSFVLEPKGWRVEPLAGRVFGGEATGSLSAETPDAPAGVEGISFADAPIQFVLAIERAKLGRVLAVVPALGTLAEGDARIRVAGRLGESTEGEGEIRVDRGSVAGLPLSELRMPIRFALAPGSESGSIETRRWEARLAGGRLEGTARLRVGLSRAFRTETKLTDVEIEFLTRLLSDARHPAAGKVSGVLTLEGADPARPETYTGRAALELQDAEVLDLPVFRLLDRFLGGPAGGGAFQEGTISAGIGNREVKVEELALVGRVAQLHATGTIGFDGRLDLIVLVNTNQIISETGQALLARIPGLSSARGAQATSKLSGFLSNRLIKLRVSGTLSDPNIALDPGATVTNAAAGFFAGALKLPLGLFR